MTGIAIFLLGAAVAFGLARWLRVPEIPVLVLIGFLLSLGGALPRELVEDALVLGVTVMLFVAGIELNLQRVGDQKRAALSVGTVQFVALGAAGLGTALLLGFALQTSLYLALALAASSTLIGVRVLQARQQLFEPFGRLVIGVLLLQDAAVILLIPVLTRLPDGTVAVGLGVLGAAAFLALTAACLRWVTPWLMLRLRHDEESLLLTALAVLFLFLGVAHLIDLPLMAGAFLAGVALSPFPASALLRAKLKSISDFFLAFLFTALGAFLVIPSLTHLLHALVLAAVVVVLTPPLVTWVAERAGLPARQAIEGGLLLAQTSELSLIVGLHGLALGHLDAGVFSTLALVTVLTMLMAPALTADPVARGLMRLHPMRRAMPEVEPPRDHVLLLGCGETGMILLETLILFEHDVLVVDDDPEVIRRLQEAGIPCLRGDASDPDLLERAGARQARLILSTMRYPEDNRTLLEHVRGRGVEVLARVFDPEAGKEIRRLGGEPIVLSDATSEDLLAWLDRAEAIPSAPRD